MTPRGDRGGAPPGDGPRPGRLDARLIGPPLLRWRGPDGDVPIDARGKPFALLCWLAQAPGAVPKDELAELFWGPAKRHNLRVALHALRKQPGATAWLRSEGDTVAVDADTDLDAFERAVRDGEPERAVATWREGAGTLDADAALLAGVVAPNAPAFPDAVAEARRRASERYRRALVAAAERHRAAGDLEAARAHLDEALAIDPLDEDGVRRAMRLDAALGRRAAAVARYERLRRELAAELDVAPAPATRELHDALRSAASGTPPAPPADPLGPLRSLRRTRFVARAGELDRIEAAFEEGRWLTLLGPGGVGKSRLALEYAERHRAADAVGGPADAAPPTAIVAFEGLDDPSTWAEAAAHALGVPLPGGGPADAQLEAALRDREALLVLDGLEVARAAWPTLGALSERTPGLRILATSRLRLGLPGERVLAVPPLALGVDGADDDPLASEAGRLLLAAARRDDVAFEPGPRERRALARICAAVDGMPLSLELAAGWLRLFGAERLATRLEDDPLALDDPAASETTRGLRAAIARSWSLLSGEERGTLAGLAVFRGGFDTEAGLDVAGDARPRTLLALVDASLLQRVGDGRFDLHAGVRAWVLERAEAERLAAARARHARRFLGELLGSAADPATGEAVHHDRLDRDHDNLMAAWRWACEAGDAELLDGALDALALYLRSAERNDEGRAAMARAVDALGSRGVGRAGLAARARVRLAWFASITGRDEEAVAALDAAVPDLTDDPRRQAEARRNLGAALSNLGRFAEAGRQLRVAAELFARLEDPLNLARTSNYLGIDAARRGDAEEATRHYRACLAHARAAGSEPGVAAALANLGEVALHDGRTEAAAEMLRDALDRFVQRGYRNGEAAVRSDLGLLACILGDAEAGRRELTAALALYRRLGRVREEAETLAELARVGGDEGWAYAEEALTLARRIGHPTTEAVALARLAELHGREGRATQQRRTLDEARRVAGPRAAPRLVAALAAAERQLGDGGSG